MSDAKNWTHEEAAVAVGEKDHRIPFMIKSANAKPEKLVFDSEFNTVLTQTLVIAIYNGEVLSMEEIAAWIDNNRK